MTRPNPVSLINRRWLPVVAGVISLFIAANRGHAEAAEHGEPAAAPAHTTAAEAHEAAEVPHPVASTTTESATNAEAVTDTATNAPVHAPDERALARYNDLLVEARFLANSREFRQAEANYVKLLASNIPLETTKTALFELGGVVQAQNDLPRAQAIYTQYQQRWPGDARTPEVCLQQGRVFRQMSLANLALTKFYAVMTTALSLQNNQLPYYKRLVLQAQVEIAETHYLVGKYKDAADYYSRLLAQNDPSLDRPQIQFRLIRSLEAIKSYDEAANQAQDYLTRYPNSPDQPEVRYHLAQAYKGQGRNAEALKQVEIFLKEERDKTKNQPEVWAYWQQRVGNEIGNELYMEGDYVKAVQIYLALAQLDDSPAWQFPVRYQVGITYEKLLQPELAVEAYRSIVSQADSLGTNASPSLKSVVDMAGWRLNFLEWNKKAEAFNRPGQAQSNTNSPNLTQR